MCIKKGFKGLGCFEDVGELLVDIRVTAFLSQGWVGSNAPKAGPYASQVGPKAKLGRAKGEPIASAEKAIHRDRRPLREASMALRRSGEMRREGHFQSRSVFRSNAKGAAPIEKLVVGRGEMRPNSDPVGSNASRNHNAVG